MNPCGVARGERSMLTLYVSHRKSNNVKVIIHNGAAKNHTVMLDTGSQQSMIGMEGRVIIKHHDSWIDAQGVDMGGSSD